MTNLPQGWEVKKLEEIANIKGGKRLPKGENLLDNNTKFAYIRVVDFQDNGTINLQNIKFINENTYNVLKNYKIYDDNLYISIAGTIGKSGIIPKELNGAILTENAVKLEYIQNNISNKFMYFFTLSNIFKTQIQTSTKIVAQPKLAITRLKQIQIPLPPLKEQERIVGILDESFAKIDESIKILEQNLLNLDELMQSALQKAFNPLNDNTKENYQLPQGWEWKSLNEICEINPRNKVDDEINISFVSMDKILDGYNNGFSYVIKKWKDVKKGFTHFKQGDIGLAKITPCFENKKSVIFNNLENGVGAGTTELHIIRVGNHIISKFLLWFFKTEKFTKNGILNMTGATGHKRVPKDFIKNLQIPLPPLQEQEQITSYLDELSLNIKNLKQNYQTQIKNLQELKKSLLDKAFKGRL
ncbi:restriction endonuclease subunit S [Campylobacter jejuni]|nr:restriction endonuclease subunit S [Campylobacter jejuni]MCC3060272.1 restriction endonuclease subunit S [Campylobacter jejuni]MCG4190811.1 restriction endonuclease subunit S [Campylobacter jejuni]